MGNTTITPALYDHSDAAPYLKITPRHLRDLVARREIGFVRVGRLIRFRLADLDEYIERNAQPARVQARAAPNTRRPPHPKAKAVVDTDVVQAVSAGYRGPVVATTHEVAP